AKIKGKIDFLLFNLAGNLDEAILGVHDCLCLPAVEFQSAGWGDSKLAIWIIDEHIVVAKDGGRKVDLGGHAWRHHTIPAVWFARHSRCFQRGKGNPHASDNDLARWPG